MLKLTTYCASLAAAALAVPALAQNETPVRTATVSYADLDLASQEGVETLHSRVRRAVRDVCDFNDAYQTRRFYEANRCAHRAMKGAQPQVHTAVSQFGRDIRRADAAIAIEIAS